MADIEFNIRIASTGDTFIVPTNKTILDVLWENGIEKDFGCGAGMCNTCTTTYLEGTVEHKDLLFSEEIDHTTQLTVCISRATSDLLVLDL
tara:strand:+ start:187 stop:459 length:273 start_codon:yes stop_codon:yes gene_type:complete